jgi:hypothetical protein
MAKKEIVKLVATPTGLVFRHVRYTKGGPITIEETDITIPIGRVKQFNLEQQKKEYPHLNNSKTHD